MSRQSVRLGDAPKRLVAASLLRDGEPALRYIRKQMNEDVAQHLQALKSEHRRLDAEIAARLAAGEADQLEIARLKRRKLRLKDEIQLILDRNVPDIIA